MVTRGLKKLLRKPAESAAYFVMRRVVSLERCPAAAADLLDIRAPRCTVPHPEPSPEGSANINIILALLNRTAHVTGDIAECGVFRGSTLLAMGLFVKQHKSSRTVLGFDSFEGFGSGIEFDLRLGGAEVPDKRLGGFGDTSYDVIREKIRRLGLSDVIQLQRGFFAQTLPSHSNRRFSFVHLDCDIYQSYKECLEFFYPRVASGGIILFDEYNDPPWPGCNMAIDEFLGDKPEKPTRIDSDNFLKWYIQRK